MNRSLLGLKALVFLAILALPGTPADAYERLYSLGDKIDGASLVVWAEVAEVRELKTAKAQDRSEPEIIADYLYRLRSKAAAKGRLKNREVLVIQSPEYRAEPRYFQKGQQVIAFLKPTNPGASFLKKYRLAPARYYETFAYKQGVLAVDDSSAPGYVKAIELFLSARKAPRERRAALWAALLESNIPDLKASALSELSDYRYYPALNHYLRALAEENYTALAARILVQMDPESLRPRLPLLLMLDRAENKRVRINMLQVASGIQDPRVYDLLLKSIKDENFQIRTQAAKGLGRYPEPQAIKALKKALKDQDDFVRDAAAESLRGMGFEIEKKNGYYRIIKEPKSGKR